MDLSLEGIKEKFKEVLDIKSFQQRYSDFYLEGTYFKAHYEEGDIQLFHNDDEDMIDYPFSCSLNKVQDLKRVIDVLISAGFSVCVPSSPFKDTTYEYYP
jgi:hypothetical protein